ncbi:uncharacterized protein LOC118153509 [Callithrix jacchus]
MRIPPRHPSASNLQTPTRFEWSLRPEHSWITTGGVPAHSPGSAGSPHGTLRDCAAGSGRPLSPASAGRSPGRPEGEKLGEAPEVKGQLRAQTVYTRPLKSKRPRGWATLGGTRSGPPRRRRAAAGSPQDTLASGASRPWGTYSARRTLHLHPKLPIAQTAPPLGLRQGVPGAAAPDLPALGDCRGAGSGVRAPPPAPGSAPRPGPQSPASAAPPRACPGRWNTETLNTEDARRRARGATQAPPLALVPPRPRTPEPSSLTSACAPPASPGSASAAPLPAAPKGRGLKCSANIPPPPRAGFCSRSRERSHHLLDARERGRAGRSRTRRTLSILHRKPSTGSAAFALGRLEGSARSSPASTESALEKTEGPVRSRASLASGL